MSNPSDKTLATYDHDLDPENDDHFYCVVDDEGYRATGFPTRAEAEAYSDGIDYCQVSELSNKGVFAAQSEEEAIEHAKRQETLDPDENDKEL